MKKTSAAISVTAGLILLGTSAGAPAQAPRSDILGPGWHAVSQPPLAARRVSDVTQEAFDTITEEKGGVSKRNLNGPAAPSPEIVELARGLLHDPVRIYQYVLNHIRYQPYFGALKGPTLTLLERSGNDFDQSMLLVALLRQSGYAPVFRFGEMDMLFDEPDHMDVEHWIGADPIAASTIVASGGIHGVRYVDEEDNSLFLRMQRVWVEVTIGSTTCHLDPAFKPSQETTGVDLGAVTGYNQTNFLAALGGTNTSSAAQGLDPAVLETELSAYTMNLVNYIRTNRPNASVEEIYGGREVVQRRISALPTSLKFAAYPTATWTNIPASYQTTVRFRLTNGELDDTWDTAAIEGGRITLAFGTNGHGQLWLDDTLIATEAGGAAGSSVSLQITVNHPYEANGYGNYQDQTETKEYQRSGIYAILYGFGGSDSGGLLKKRQQQLEKYLSAGLAHSSRQVLSETLNTMGMDWMKQTELGRTMMDRLANVCSIQHHRFGRMGQEAGFYVDVGLQTVSILDRIDGSGKEGPAFRTANLYSSAMEHGMIEQLQTAQAAASTVRMFQIANNAGEKIFLADSSSYSSIRPQLSGYDTSLLNDFQSLVSSGYKLVLPQNGNHYVGEWLGTGYIQYWDDGSSRSQGMIINGGYNGGFAGTPGLVVIGDNQAYYVNDPRFWDPETGTFRNPTGADPVDMFTGGYGLETLDLSVGQSEPRGLHFIRSYSSSKNLLPSPLGYGWGHNYQSSLFIRTDTPAAFGCTTPVDAAAFAAAITVALDLMQDPSTAGRWVAAALASGWGVDQLRHNSVAISIGRKSLQYVRLPDGTYNPPAGVTTRLVRDGTNLFRLEGKFDAATRFNAAGRISSFTDVDGNAMTYAYDANTNQLVSVSDTYGRVFSFGYATNGLIEKVTETAGTHTREVHFTYSPTGDLLTSSDPLGALWRFEYDGEHRIIRVLNPMAQTTLVISYDSLGRVKEQQFEGDTNKTWTCHFSGFENAEINPAGGRKVHYFDEKGRLVGMENAMGERETLVYDGQDHVVEIIDGRSNSVVREYDGRHNITKKIDARGGETLYRHDSFSRLDEVEDPDGDITRFEYDAEHHLTKTIDPLLNETVLTYTPGGQPLSAKDPNGNTTTNTYDAYGNLDLVIRADASVMDCDYDARGNLLSMTDGESRSVTFTYDECRRLLATRDENNLGITNTYDLAGNLATSTDRFRNTSAFDYSPMRRLQSVILPNGGVVRYGYDVRDCRTSLQDALGLVTRFVYDDAGRPQEAINPLGHTNQFTYDANGNQLTRRNPNNQTTAFEHDAANQLTRIATPRGRQTTITYTADRLPETIREPSGQTVTNHYDANGRPVALNFSDATVSLAYDAGGRLKTVTEGSVTLGRAYDPMNRLVSFTNANGHVIGYGYDKAGNLAFITYPGNKTVAYAYDDGNRLIGVTDWNGRATTYGYDSLGRLQQTIRPNGTRQTITYNTAGQPTVLEDTTSNGIPIVRFEYEYNLADMLTRQTRVPDLSVTLPPGNTFTHDGDNRVLTTDGVPTAFDADGNLTRGPLSGASASFAYDSRNRLIQAGGLTYTYDPEGRRVGIADTNGLTELIISPLNVLEQLLAQTPPGGPTTYYVYGRGGLLYEETAGATRTYHFDIRGNTAALTDDSGSVTGQAHYSPYGHLVHRQGNLNTPFLFNGRFGVMTDANGLLHMRMRYYSTELRRFLNTDPIGLAGGPNTFAFANGDPINLFDPFGLGFLDYLGKSFDQLIFGNYTDNVTLLGTGMQIGTGLLGVDLPGDIRDLFQDFTHWEWSWGHAGKTLFDGVGLFPLIGAIKYADEGATLLKNADNAARTADKFSRSPKSLMDEMVLDAAEQGKGQKIIDNLGDPQFKGMEKWSYGETSAQGLRSEVHYVRDPKTGQLMDFKFKHHAETYK